MPALMFRLKDFERLCLADSPASFGVLLEDEIHVRLPCVMLKGVAFWSTIWEAW